MSASALQLNWTNVMWPNTSQTLVHVTSVMFNKNGTLLDFAGDNDRYPVIIANPMNKPSASITTGDVATLMGLTVGASGTLLASQDDALGATGGGIDWSLANAVHESCQDTGQFGQFGTATATFRAYSSDGTTNPLTIASRF